MLLTLYSLRRYNIEKNKRISNGVTQRIAVQVSKMAILLVQTRNLKGGYNYVKENQAFA